MSDPTIHDVAGQTEELQGELALRHLERSSGRRPAESLERLFSRFPLAASTEAIDLIRVAPIDGDEEARRRDALLEATIAGFVGRETRRLAADLETRADASVAVSDRGPRPPRSLLAGASAEVDASARHAFVAAFVGHVEELEPLLAEKLSLERGIARRLGFDDVVDVRCRLGSFDVDATVAALEELLADTHDMYHDVLGWSVKRAVGVELAEATIGDVLFTLGVRHAEAERGIETSDDAPALLARFVPQLGLDLRVGGNVTLETGPGPADTPRALVAAVRVPHDVRLVYRVVEGRPAHHAFLDAVGRAFALAHRPGAGPMADRVLGDPSVVIAFGRMLSALPSNRSFATRELGVAKARDLTQACLVERLFEARTAAARLLHEVDLRRAATVTEHRAAFGERLRGALGIRYPDALYLWDIREPLAAVDQARAVLLEGALTKHLVHYFDDDWYRNPRAGRFLQDLWGRGGALSFEGLMAHLGHERATGRPLAELFGRNL